MRKNLIFLAVATSLLFISCKNDPIEDLSLKEIFESLPAVENVSETNMKIENVSPGDGPDYQILLYSNAELIKTSKAIFKIIAQDLAFGEGPYGTLYIANKSAVIRIEAADLLLNSSNSMNFHSYQIRANKNDAYIKGELWSDDGTEILKEVYFRYSLINNILTNEAGQKIIFYNY